MGFVQKNSIKTPIQYMKGIAAPVDHNPNTASEVNN